MNCPSCQQKILLLQQAFERIDNNGFNIITVHGPAREEAIKNYCSSHGLTLPVLLDLQANVGSAYDVIQLPATFILDRYGVVRSVNPEFESQEDLYRLIGPFLSDASNGGSGD
jgi:peroxiredoxin